MITVLVGDNSFEVSRALDVLRADFDGEAELIDGSELELRQLPDLLMGGTLFASKRLVIIKRLADNKIIWPVFDEWIGRVSDDVQLVLVEPTLDKRTKTYKLLKANADVRDYPAWKEGDVHTAQQWLVREAADRSIALDTASQRALVDQIGADQWQLHYALEKLAVLDTVTPDVVRDVIEPTPTDSVFALFDTALRADRAGVRRIISTLEHTEEPYRVFGLLAGQATQFAALTLTDKPSAEVASALGVHPFGLQKLQSHARIAGRAGARRLVRYFVEADHRMKTGGDDPWVIIEATLMLCAGHGV
jgi:DNA polymerase-3 subunit delta